MALIELAPDIYYIPGKNKSRFPYCACLYLKGNNIRVLIDAGMGTRNLAPVKKMGIDVLLFSHCHIDHRLTQQAISDVPVWCHVKEEPFFRNKEKLFSGIGFSRSGIDVNQLFKNASGTLNIEVARTLEWFKGRNLFYSTYPDYPDLIQWFELVHIEKHLARLANRGKVVNNSGHWQRQAKRIAHGA